MTEKPNSPQNITPPTGAPPTTAPARPSAWSSQRDRIWRSYVTNKAFIFHPTDRDARKRHADALLGLLSITDPLGQEETLLVLADMAQRKHTLITRKSINAALEVAWQAPSQRLEQVAYAYARTALERAPWLANELMVAQLLDFSMRQGTRATAQDELFSLLLLLAKERPILFDTVQTERLLQALLALPFPVPPKAAIRPEEDWNHRGHLFALWQGMLATTALLEKAPHIQPSAAQLQLFQQKAMQSVVAGNGLANFLPELSDFNFYTLQPAAKQVRSTRARQFIRPIASLAQGTPLPPTATSPNARRQPRLPAPKP